MSHIINSFPAWLESKSVENALAPAISQALAPFAPRAESAEMADYRKQLREHDWEFEYADLGYTRGLYERKALEKLRKELDPSGEVWNAIAPANHRV